VAAQGFGIAFPGIFIFSAGFKNIPLTEYLRGLYWQ
jgi:hypothetical protein